MSTSAAGLLLDGLVATKLVPPAQDPRAIFRESLIAKQVDDARHSSVTAIVAAAGSGKSTLMTQLHSAFEERRIGTCWLSLEAEDNDPATFAIYFISALNSIEPSFARDELTALEANPVRDFDRLFDRLVGRLASVAATGAVFIDDFQHITDERTLRFLDKLITHLPRTMRLVIASRSSLLLQLARLRVSGALTEVGQEELYFDTTQTDQFLRRYHRLELSPEDLGALLESTEGWPTGVQLAALALRRHKGPAGELIKTFSGRDRDLTRYLVESVIHAQPESVRSFLLKTSPLRRMCRDLCRDTTGQPDSDELLEYVGRANLFLIALDRDGQWYRYHHLFAEFLQSEFRRTEPDEYRQICHRAAKWCEANGQAAEAIRYALDAEHFDEAAILIARHAPTASLFRGDHYTVLDWMRRLPPEFHGRRPEILLSHAWSCAFSRDTARAMQISQQVLAELSGNHPDRWDLSEAERDRFELWTRNLQAATHACADDIEDCLARATELRPKVPETEPFLIATLSNCLSYGYFAKRDFERSREAAVAAHEYGHRADAAYLSAWGDFLHGLVDVELGRLYEAERFGQRVQQDSQGLGLGQKSYVAGLAALLNAEIAIQRCDFEKAPNFIGGGRAFKEIFGPVEPQLVAVRNEARLHAHLGHLDLARQILQQGQDAALREQHLRLYFALSIEEASLQLTAGDIAGANDTAQRAKLRGDAADRTGIFRTQRDALKLLEARFWIAEENPRSATRMLTLLQQARGAETRGGFFLAVTANRAVSLWNGGQRKEAARQLDCALTSAAAEFHAYPIVTAGRALLPVLESIIVRRPDAAAADLRQKLELQTWLACHLRGESHSPRPGSITVADVPKERAERLTGREVELLRLLQSGLDNRTLADALLVSEATVKWHLHNLYSKLGVRSRGAAVARASQMGLA
ncbi:LuxR C-terminal-related transcriptional regulator [Methylibium sp.]|uniref:LuxR C-terminal-related transcriptional regulator n=1 Tax=Methylibium sp. TaxID=2067992 RepID=UPI003D0DE000